MWKNRAQSYVRPSPQYSFINSGGQYITDPLPQYGASRRRRRLSMYCCSSWLYICAPGAALIRNFDILVLTRMVPLQRINATALAGLYTSATQPNVRTNFCRADWDSWITLHFVRHIWIESKGCHAIHFICNFCPNSTLPSCNLQCSIQDTDTQLGGW